MGNVEPTRGKTAEALYTAAQEALVAPSIFNSQPWRWIVHDDRLELFADRSRQLRAVDPQGRLLTVSCGVAAHHALMAVDGHRVEFQLLPDVQQPDLLAVLTPAGTAAADRRQEALHRAMTQRRTDRRAFTRAPVDAKVLDRLSAACGAQGAHLHFVPWHQMSSIALAAVAAGALQLSDPAYRVELADWTHRPPWSGDGVPLATAVGAASRRVPVRDFAPFGGDVMSPGPDNDWGATYSVIYTGGDSVADWLAAGMSLSAVLLTATSAGLGSATISDITEAPAIRQLLTQLLPTGYPQVAVRVGHPQAGELPSAPRRAAQEVISFAASPAA